MSQDSALREQLVKLLTWQDAHVGLERALQDLAPAARGKRPPRMAHSVWEILEHLRIAQEDILEFSRGDGYVEKTWPDDYWPAATQPADDAAWHASAKAFARDLEAFCVLVRDPARELFTPLPNGSGQTLLREALLIADHNAYHVGEIVAVRRALGEWGE